MIRAAATIGSTIGQDQVPDYLKPTWVNPANKVMPLDQMKVPTAKSDRTQPPASKKVTPRKIEQSDLLGAAGTMLGYIRSAGIKPPADYFALYQIFHESNGFTSQLYSFHYNASGIKYAGQQGATKGDNGYAWFTNWKDYFRAFAHELAKGTNPAGAQTLEEYAQRLKANGYYEDTYENYLAGLYRAQKALSAFKGGADIHAPYSDPGNWFTQWWHNLSFIKKVEYGLLGGLAAAIIIKRVL